MRLLSIPADKYEDYRLDVIFDGYKWDPQYLDNNTIAKHALVITRQEHEELAALAQKLDKETTGAELMLYQNKELAKPLKLPQNICNQLWKTSNYEPGNHIRLMRYDFHPTLEGKWALSEVNSDVPGGLAEASLMPKIVAELFGSDSGGKTGGNSYSFVDFSEIFTKAVSKKVKAEGTIAFIHCTSYSDDRQVMQFLGDRLTGVGFKAIYAAADHLRFEDNEAVSILAGSEGKIDAIIRFTPLEWLIKMKPRRSKSWHGFFRTVTPSCNHPVAMLAQTKRFPLVWDALIDIDSSLSMSTWREFLPETLEVGDIKGRADRDDFIFKPVYGRVGENISIKEACIDDEYKKIIKDVKLHKRKYLAQKRFNSMPLLSDEGQQYHVCIGAYCVEGMFAGFYARAGEKPRIDSSAADIPVLIDDSL